MPALALKRLELRDIGPFGLAGRSKGNAVAAAQHQPSRRSRNSASPSIARRYHWSKCRRERICRRDARSCRGYARHDGHGSSGRIPHPGPSKVPALHRAPSLRRRNARTDAVRRLPTRHPGTGTNRRRLHRQLLPFLPEHLEDVQFFRLALDRHLVEVACRALQQFRQARATVSPLVRACPAFGQTGGRAAVLTVSPK